MSASAGFASTWHPAHLTADDARTLRAEDAEEAVRAAPVLSTAHVMHYLPLTTVKPLSWGYRITRAIARAVVWTGLAGAVVVALWAVLVFVAA